MPRRNTLKKTLNSFAAAAELNIMKNPLLNQAPLRPEKFDGTNITYAANQPEYDPLPAMLVEGDHGMVVFCWKLNFWQRILVLFTGRVWHSVLTFRQPLQPQLLSASPLVVEYQKRLQERVETALVWAAGLMSFSVVLLVIHFLFHRE